jgi:Ca2+-binding EF-hand superfamily protein
MVRRALGLESSRDEMQEILETVDPDDDGFVVYERLLEVAALKMRCMLYPCLRTVLVSGVGCL